MLEAREILDRGELRVDSKHGAVVQLDRGRDDTSRKQRVESASRVSEQRLFAAVRSITERYFDVNVGVDDHDPGLDQHQQ